MTTEHIRPPGLLTDVDTSARCPIGTKWRDASTGKRYMYCYNAGGTSWTVGVPVGVFLTADALGEASFTAATQLLVAEGGTDVTAVAGVALGTVATTEYGWLQVGGPGEVLVTDGNVTASLGMYVADNGVVALPTTEATHIGMFAVAIDADSGTNCPKYILKGCWFDF